MEDCGAARQLPAVRFASKWRLRLAPLLAAGLLSLGVAACGGANKSTGPASSAASSSAAANSPKRKATVNGTLNRDSLLYFGRPASPAEMRAVTALLERYYAVAAAGDGAAACSMIYSIIAETIPEDYGQPPGPPALRGKTCAVVMTKILEQHRRELVAKAPGLRVIGLRVGGTRGLALLRFGRAPERYILVRREYGAWKIGVLFDSALP